MTMQPMRRLSDVATIQAGTSVSRTKKDGKRDSTLPFDDDGNASIIQQGDIRDGKISADIDRIHFTETKIEAQKLQGGDVLLRSKGNPMSCAVFKDNETNSLPTIAASAILILRPRSDVLLPGFLAWLINSTWGQKMLADRRTGKTIPIISRRVLDDVTIPIPPLQEQKRIAELAMLAKKHEQLAAQYREKIDNLLIAQSLGFGTTEQEERT
jgi:restriction endonuclease S subunit